MPGPIRATETGTATATETSYIGQTVSVTLALRILGIAALTLVAACGAQSSSSTGSLSLAPRSAQVRRVAFDNSYGPATALQVHVAVDGAAEQTYPAACDAKTCTFLVLLTNGPHTLTLAVERDGVRSDVTTFTVEAPSAPKR